jgi:hypothetical protein
MVDSTSGSSIPLSAIVTGTAALIGPALALARWIQEKQTKHRCREELVRSREIFEFIQRCPEMLSTAESTEPALLESARVELAKSLTTIELLLKKRAATGAPPLEMAWPRRVLLLYAPRTWGATFLHIGFHLLTMIGLLMLYALGFNEADLFQWGRYLDLLHHPLAGILFFGAGFLGFQAWTLWYIASTKDRWDNTLPQDTEQAGMFLLRVPVSVRELFARVLLAWGLFDLPMALVARGVRAGLLSRGIQFVPGLAAIVDDLPKRSAWENIYGWVISILCLVLAFFWAHAEFSVGEKEVWLPFPHNLRFLYPSSHWKERFAQISLLLFAGFVALQVYRTVYSIPFVNRIAQLAPDDGGGLMFGTLLSHGLAIVSGGLLPLYACYRLGLITYLSESEKSATSGRKSKPAAAHT